MVLAMDLRGLRANDGHNVSLVPNPVEVGDIQYTSDPMIYNNKFYIPYKDMLLATISGYTYKLGEDDGRQFILIANTDTSSLPEGVNYFTFIIINFFY